MCNGHLIRKEEGHASLKIKQGTSYSKTRILIESDALIDSCKKVIKSPTLKQHNNELIVLWKGTHSKGERLDLLNTRIIHMKTIINEKQKTTMYNNI